MPELIDKIEALGKLQVMYIQIERACGDGNLVAKGVRKAYKAIERMPTIDAEPVRSGRWVNDIFCSECNRFPVDVSVSISNRELTKYFSRCPHCGARMGE